MLPIPFSEYVPELLRSSLANDAGGLALCNSTDDHLAGWLKELLRYWILRSAEFCPSSIIDELGYYVAADIQPNDSLDLKRKKIYNAIDWHKNRGTFNDGTKELVDLYCGENSRIYKGQSFLSEFLIWASEASDPDDYTGTLGMDGADDALGADIIGSWYEDVIDGVVDIDCDCGMNEALAPVTMVAGGNGITILLDNGNYCIIYQKASDSLLRFDLYDSSDVLIIDNVKPALNVPASFSAVPLSGNGFAIIATQNPAFNSVMCFQYDSDGVLVDFNSFSPDGSSQFECVNAVRLTGDTWVASLSGNASNSYCYLFDVIEETKIVNSTIYRTEGCVCRYSDTQFLWAYRDKDDSDKGKFAGYNTDGTVFLAETTFCNSAIRQCGIQLLDDTLKRIVIFYARNAVSRNAYFTMYDNATLYKSETKLFTDTTLSDPYFDDGLAQLNHRVCVGNGGVWTAGVYVDISGSNYAYLVAKNIYGDDIEYRQSNKGVVTNITGLEIDGDNRIIVTYTEGANQIYKKVIQQAGFGMIENLKKSLEDRVPAYLQSVLGFTNEDDDYFYPYSNGYI